MADDLDATGGAVTWPASEDEAVSWLRERGLAADRTLYDKKTFSDAALSLRLRNPALAFTVLLDALSDARSVRRARSNRRRIGSFHADSSRLLNRRLLRTPIGRALVITVVCLALALATRPLGVRGLVQLGLVTIALVAVGRRNAAAVTVVGLVLATAIVVRPSAWWECGYALFAGWCLVHFVALWRLTSGPWWSRGPVLGFVPWRSRVRLRLARRATMLAVAVDLTTSRRGDAAPFVAQCSNLPARVQPIVHMCGALLTFDRGEVQTALTDAARAVEAARSGPNTIHGWCLAQMAFILQQSGGAEAIRYRGHAMTLLARRRSCRRVHRDLLLSQMRHELTTWPRRSAIGIIHAHRLKAIRRHDYDFLHTTEMWLCQLMIAEGNDAGAGFLLGELVGGEDGRVAMHAPRDETPEHLLLRSSVLLNRPSSGRRADDAIRRDVHVALAMLDAARRPLAATTAHLLLAKLDHAEQADTAVANAGYALVVAQHGRYMLPSPRWRESWNRTQLDAHATALAYAAEGRDSELVAEIIEIARGEVLPAPADVPSLSLLAGLEASRSEGAAVDPRARPDRSATAGASAVLAFQGLSPVRQPPRVRIGPRLRLERLDPTVEDIDLELAIDAVAPRTWYWTAATVLDQYYWAVRSPDGRWYHGHTPMAPGTPAAAAYLDLGKALPFAQPGENGAATADRVYNGPLGRSADRTREVSLLRRVARAFLPEPLAAGLARAGEAATLVVSLPAALGHLPVAGLPLDDSSDRRVVEAAAVVHMPSWSVVGTPAREAAGRPTTRWPARLALVAPHGDDDMRLLTKPRGVERTVAGPLTRSQVRDVVHAISTDRDWLLTIVGHVDHDRINPASSGLRLGAGHLTMDDLIDTGATRAFAMPDRVLLIGCGSIGFGAAPSPGLRLTPTSEWLGLGAAVLLAGATDVCCTLYTVWATDQMRRIVDDLIAGLSTTASAPEAVRLVQLDELARWRTTGDNHPVQWLALAYVGAGWSR